MLVQNTTGQMYSSVYYFFFPSFTVPPAVSTVTAFEHSLRCFLSSALPMGAITIAAEWVQGEQTCLPVMQSCKPCKHN